MNAPVWKRHSIPSPCVNICVVHPETRLCTGCARTIDEIAGWAKYSDDERQAIMEDLPNREAAPKRRRGGRAARLRGTDPTEG